MEEIRRQAGPGTGAPPDLEGILGRLLGAQGGQGVPGGSTATRSAPGPGGGGLMDILQSPALQQLTGQLFGPLPGMQSSGLILLATLLSRCQVGSFLMQPYVTLRSHPIILFWCC